MALLMMGSAASKFVEWDGKAKMFADLGFTADLMTKIGILEVVITLLYLIPQTAFVGAILLTSYLGGAIVAHVRVGEPFLFPVILGVLIWVGVALRYPAIWKLAQGKDPAPRA